MGQLGRRGGYRTRGIVKVTPPIAIWVFNVPSRFCVHPFFATMCNDELRQKKADIEKGIHNLETISFPNISLKIHLKATSSPSRVVVVRGLVFEVT